MVTVTALYVDPNGCYAGLPGVDPWDEDRDARLYAGPHPVVAHPPCQRWGKLWAGQPLWIKRTGERKKKGDDGGCFAAALASVRKWGGVMEHPWGSHAWPHFGLNTPPRNGGWITADFDGCDLPELDWGKSVPHFPPEVIERYGLAYCKRAGELAFQGGGRDSAPRIGTPEPFRDLLVGMARHAVPCSVETAA